MATTDLQLEQPGSLKRPGPIGRLVRFGFGALCIYWVYSLLTIAATPISDSGQVRAPIWNGILIGLFLVSYVVNIGFSRQWKKWPAGISATAMIVLAGYGYAATGSIETALFARAVWLWELYIAVHLGSAFLVAAAIATPGCEMRAFHDLYSRVTGHPVMEHHCPVGPLHPIDRWEAGRLSSRPR